MSAGQLLARLRGSQSVALTPSQAESQVGVSSLLSALSHLHLFCSHKGEVTWAGESCNQRGSLMFLWQNLRGPFPLSAPHIGDTPLAQGANGIPGINVVHSPLPPQTSHF